MGEAVLSALVQVIFERLSSQVLEEYGWLSRGAVNDQIRKLQSLLSTIQLVLEDAEDRQVVDKVVKDWLIKLKNIAYDADDLLDEYVTEALKHKMESHHLMEMRGCVINTVCHFCSQKNLVFSRYIMKNKLKKIVERLDTIADERFKFHLRDSTCSSDNGKLSSWSRLQSDSYLFESEVFGRSEEKEKIIHCLMNPTDPRDVSVITIVGMGGLGKTTLAKLVYNDKRVKEHFERRIWVCVSQAFDVKQLMRAIIESATGTRCDLLEMEAIHRRVQELIMEQRFLLVLDDVWNKDHEKWDILKNSVRHGSEGSNILVTTRSEKVALIMGTINPHHLEGLSDHSCWLLFQQRAFGSGTPEKASNLEAIGKEISMKCKGVPLAAKALGSSLRLKRESDYWLTIRDSEMWNFIEEENGIFPVLRLSYNSLPSHLKQCFAYCSLYPKNYRIKKENLIHLWIAEGFVRSSRGKQLEEVANEYFNELIWGSFFQNAAKDSNGEIVEVEMHHLLHDLANSVADDNCLMLEASKKAYIPSDTRHLSVICCNEANYLNGIGNCLKLRSFLLLFGRRKIAKVSHKLILSMRSLRSLDISSTGIKKVSKSVGLLIHLRYLNLSDTLIKELPNSICNLFNLQTLVLLHCNRLQKLPEDLRKLINLRHLNIHGCELISKLPSGIGELSSLKTLPMFIVGEETGCSIAELKNLDLHGELKIKNLENVSNAGSAKDANLKSKRHIQSLRLIWNDCNDVTTRENADRIAEALQPNSNLKKLALENYMGSKLPSWLMNSYLANIVELSLFRCQRCVQLPSLQKLPSLQNLAIDEMDSTMYFCNDSGQSSGVDDFVTLKRLSLKSMPNLLGWSSIEGRIVLPHLKELKVDDAPRLINLPDLPSIECLELDFCREEVLTSATKITSPLKNFIISGFVKLISFPQGLLTNKTHLLSLEIRNCEKLESFSHELKSLSSLQSLCISNCPEIKSLSELEGLKSLKSLGIDRCAGLLSLPEELKALKSLQHLSLSNCENITALPAAMQHLTGLHTLHIWSCANLVALPGWLGNLVGLREMELWYCENLVCLPESMKHLTALQFLSIWGCPLLEVHLEKDTGADWHKIKHIPFIKINGPYIQIMDDVK